MKNRSYAYIVLLLPILTGCLLGCSTKKPLTAEEHKQQLEAQAETIKVYSQLAEKHNVIIVGQIGHDGRLGLYQSAEIGLDTGANANATLIFLPPDMLTQLPGGK